MARIICHHEGMFFEYSTVSDRPVTYAMSREEYEAYYREEHGRLGMVDLPLRLERAIRNGHSARGSGASTLKTFLNCNRAGDNDENLSFEEIIAMVTTPVEERGE